MKIVKQMKEKILMTSQMMQKTILMANERMTKMDCTMVEQTMEHLEILKLYSLYSHIHSLCITI